MKNALFLISFFLICLKPYQQVKISNEEHKIMHDTVMLSKVVDSIANDIKELESLDKKKQSLKKELKRLKKEKREEDKLKKAIEKFNNRGV